MTPQKPAPNTAVLFITVKTWKQQRCPLVNERINNLWYIQAMQYYSALKRHELPIHDMEEP